MSLLSLKTTLYPLYKKRFIYFGLLKPLTRFDSVGIYPPPGVCLHAAFMCRVRSKKSSENQPTMKKRVILSLNTL